MQPRQIIPGATYLVTRRCSQRLFLLLPSKVAAGLVKKGVYWPGVHTRADQYGEVLTFERPEFFFSARGGMPEVAELRVEIPPCHEHWSRRRCVSEITGAIEEREKEIATSLRSKGRSFLGVRGVKQQSPLGSPTSPRGFGRTSCASPAVTTGGG